MATVKLVLAFIMAIPVFISPYVQMVFHGGIDSYFEKWSADQEYTADYAVEIKKDPNKDFVVLNLADIQLDPDECYDETGAMAEETIKRCIEEKKPDLITLSGDNAWGGDLSYVHVVRLIDSYGIPWAAVMGNHDGGNGNRLREFWCSHLMANAKNCLFKFGPKGMGYGNYVINITENGKVIHSIFMMDSHTDADDTENGKINYGVKADGTPDIGYDHFWADQIKWYEWAVKGIAKQAGRTVESSVIMHIPVYEYRDAARMACDLEFSEGTDMRNVTKSTIKEEFKDNAFGSLNEGVYSAEGNNGFFAKAKELGSTKNMICGHDHVNDLSVEYEGIRLSYSVKCGPGCYWTESKNGCSLLTIDSDGAATFSHHYVDLGA